MSEPELSKAYDPTDVERRWYPVWNERGYFRAEASSTRPPYCIVLPPPNVTGSLHLGHALTATIQDILIRWKRMSGFNCLWLPGTDHAGIATQMVVERELQKTEKRSRHDLGREEFLKRVWQWKEKYGARIGEQHQVMGASLDWSRERFTMDAGVSAAVKEVFVRLYEQGLLYRDEKLINWDPQLLTALSDLEVDHEDRDGSLWHITYPVKDSAEVLTVATTRPETMLGDTAVAVHPEDKRYQHLIGRSVVLPLVGREIPIIADAELVSMEFGTGAVKITPAHDHNDYAVGKRHGLPMISIFDEKAVCNENAGPYVGLERFAARKKVLEDLVALNLLLKEEPHKLSLAISQRTGVAVEPRLSPQWFVRVKPMADKAIAAVEQGKTRFVPESWTNTFYGWMNNIHDWCVSRQLWWGHQIPAWYPADGPKLADGTLDFTKAVPTVARERPGATPENPSGEWVQDPDVLDTWFSSGLWPFSTLGWPEQTPELKAFYPNAVMETGHDIIFFWVARMMMLGLHFMGEVPFRTVYLHAMVRDEKGEKMSKTKGNVIDPLDIIRGADASALPPSVRNRFPQGMPAMGADALRFTLAALTQQGRDIKLSVDRIGGYKAFCNKVWNAARFTLMNLGDFRWDGAHPKGLPLTLADRWILARLNRAVSDTQAALTDLRFSDAASTLYQFLWGEFCDWYIELSKASLNGDDPQARDSARAVLVFCLDRILRLLHPFMPFITEEIWQKLPMERPVASICIAAYPEVDRRLDDAEAEAEMAPVIAAIDGVRTIRGESNLSPAVKVDAHVLSNDPRIRATLEKWRAYVMPLTGVKALFVGPLGARPSLAAADLRGDLEIYVPLAGVIDLAEERARLQKERSKAEAQVAGVTRKLENPSFVAKAPPEVVEKDRAQIAELTSRIKKLGETLERLTERAEVSIAPPAAGTVDLGKELHDQLTDFPLPESNREVKVALDTLRAGTQEGLSSKDHYDLGVAYMGMGLVDDAVREFNRAKEGAPTPASADAEKTPALGVPVAQAKATKPKAKKEAPATKGAPVAKAGPKTATARKAPAGKVATKAPARKAATKAPPRKAATKAPARKAATKAPARKAASKAPARKASTKAGAKGATKGGPRRPAAKRTRAKQGRP